MKNLINENKKLLTAGVVAIALFAVFLPSNLANVAEAPTSMSAAALNAVAQNNTAEAQPAVEAFDIQFKPVSYQKKEIETYFVKVLDKSGTMIDSFSLDFAHKIGSRPGLEKVGKTGLIFKKYSARVANPPVLMQPNQNYTFVISAVTPNGIVGNATNISFLAKEKNRRVAFLNIEKPTSVLSRVFSAITNPFVQLGNWIQAKTRSVKTQNSGSFQE